MRPTQQYPGTLLAIVAVISTAAVAQQPTTQQPAGLYSVTRVVVKADHVTTYRDYLKKVSEGYKKAGVTSFHVYVGISNPLEYMMVRSQKNYAAGDEGPILAKMYSETERARLNAQRDQCTTSVHVTHERAIASIGGGEPRTFRVVTRFRAKPGMNEAYVNAIRNEYVPALGKVDGVRYRVRRIEWGGSRSDYVTTNDLAKMASLDEASPQVKAFGVEGAAKWTKRMSDIGTAVEALLYRHLPEYGFTVAAQ